jgi:hypothetical protein
VPKDETLQVPVILLEDHAEHRDWLLSADRETGALPATPAEIAVECCNLGFVVAAGRGWRLTQDGRDCVVALGGRRVQ